MYFPEHVNDGDVDTVVKEHVEGITNLGSASNAAVSHGCAAIQSAPWNPTSYPDGGPPTPAVYENVVYTGCHGDTQHPHALQQRHTVGSSVGVCAAHVVDGEANQELGGGQCGGTKRLGSALLQRFRLRHDVL